MKIFGPQSFSSYLYYFFRIVAALILSLLIYIDLAFITGNFTNTNGRYHMDIPFTGTYIQGDYQLNVILTVSLVLFYFSLFFFILSNIFKALSRSIIFNERTILHLRLFTILNLIIGPILYLLIHFPIMKKSNFTDIHNLILHLIFGVVALFITHIVKRGYRVQSENDLTI